jgi:hypothetical protein
MPAATRSAKASRFQRRAWRSLAYAHQALHRRDDVAAEFAIRDAMKALHMAWMEESLSHRRQRIRPRLSCIPSDIGVQSSNSKTGSDAISGSRGESRYTIHFQGRSRPRGGFVEMVGYGTLYDVPTTILKQIVRGVLYGGSETDRRGSLLS